MRHGHKDVAELLMKFKGRPSTDDEYLSTVRDEFLKQMEEEKARKDTDKLDKELKTHKFSEVLERLARLRSDLEDDVYQFMTCASNIRYELCRILHMSMFLHDESSRTRAGWDRLSQQLDDHSLTTQKLADILERDLRQLDSSASRILKTISGDVFPWLNSACNNFHTRGLVLLLLPNFSDHLSKLVVVLNHVKALLPRLISQLVSPSGLGYDCRVFGLLCQRFLGPGCSDRQELLQLAMELICKCSSGEQPAPWPGMPRTQEAKELFKESKVAETLINGMTKPKWKPPNDYLKQTVLAPAESV